MALSFKLPTLRPYEMNWIFVFQYPWHIKWCTPNTTDMRRKVNSSVYLVLLTPFFLFLRLFFISSSRIFGAAVLLDVASSVTTGFSAAQDIRLNNALFIHTSVKTKMRTHQLQKQKYWWSDDDKLTTIGNEVRLVVFLAQTGENHFFQQQQNKDTSDNVIRGFVFGDRFPRQNVPF